MLNYIRLGYIFSVSFLGKFYFLGKVIDGSEVDEFFNLETASRWNTFLSTHTAFPEVRKEELIRMLSYINPKPGEKIIEFSTGSGYITIPLASAVSDGDHHGREGEVITYDVVEENARHVAAINKENYGLPISTKLFSFESPYVYHFEEENNSIDKVVSLATFHHCDIHKTLYNNYDTGIRGRQSIFREAARVLVPHGKLIIGDVAEDTSTQRYFEAIQEPRYCAPNGHPHSFLSKNLAEDLCRHANLSLAHYTVENIGWHFKGKTEAVQFFQGLHNAQCSSDELMQIIQQYLPCTNTKEGMSIGWELCFLIAQK